METYHQNAKLAGAAFTTTATVPPSTWFNGAQETQRQLLNSLILNSTQFDAVVDIAGIPEAANPADLTYYSDGLHPTAALASLFADETASAILGL